MLLYHGTNIRFEQVRIPQPNRTLDFGAGFYTTSSKEQAEQWATVVALRMKSGQPLLNIYELDESAIDKLAVLKFEKPTKEWLDFVCAHRVGQYKAPLYDLIIGPLANDRVMPLLQGYINAKNKALYVPFALSEIRAEVLVDQYVFKTDKALLYLNLKETIEL